MLQSAKSQTPTFNCTLTNLTQVSCNVFEYDIYLQRTGSTIFKLANMQAGITMNPAIKNGGTITVEPVIGSSGLPANMQPGPERFGYDQVDNCILITPVPPPGAANGFTVTNIPPGVRYIRVRVINSVAFAPVSPNLTFSFSLSLGYETKVAAYVGTTNTNVTSTGTFNVPASQPAFTGGFPDPLVQTVNGGGVICNVPGATGIAVGLDGSQAGYAYYLYRDGVMVTNSVIGGTGSAINFALQTVPGIYTVKSVSCTGNVDMSGSATVTVIPPVIPTIAINATPGNIVLPSTPVTYTASVTNGGTAPYLQWYVNGIPDLVNGAGVSSYLYTPLNGDQISCELYPDVDVCTEYSLVTSDTITMLVGVCSNFSDITNAEICHGGLFTWRGNSYSAAGVYYDSLTTILPPGCDSVYVLNLIVRPNYEFNTNAAICNGDVYVWRGNNYSNAGFYTESFVTAFGCDSIYSLNLTVNPVYSFVTDAQICDGDVFIWRGNNYTAQGVYYDSLLTMLGCDSVYSLNLSVNPVYAFTINADICEGSAYLWEGNSYTTAGTYTESYLTALGCDSILTLNLDVYPVYEFVTEEEICDGEIFSWRGFDYSDQGMYYDSLLTINGCDSVFVLDLTVNSLPVVSISSLGTFYCVYYDAVTMIGSPAGGAFSGPGVTGNVFDPAVAGLGSWDVVYTYTDANTCTNTETITVVVDECLSVQNFENGYFAVYPNPVQEMLTVEIVVTDASDHIWNIYDVNGKLVASGKQTLNSGVNYLSIETAHLSTGLYMLNSNVNGAIQTARIVKQLEAEGTK